MSSSDRILLAPGSLAVPSQSVGARDRWDLASGKASVWSVAARGLAYAVLFIIAMEFVIQLGRFGQNVTPIWIASAVCAWALISSPTRDWPILIGFFAAAHIARAIYTNEAPANEAIYFLNNIGGPVLCAALLRRLGGTLQFEDRASVFRFLAIAGVAAPAIATSVIAAGSTFNTDRFVLEDLRTWFLADALSYVVFLPIFWSIATGAWRQLTSPRLRTKAAVLFGILIMAHAIAWFAPPTLHNFFTIALLPYLILMAFELGSPAASTAIAITAIGVLGRGLLASPPDYTPADTTQYLLTAQFYIAALATCILPLVAALDEKNRLYESASRALGDAQAAWGELIAAEAHYRLIADNSRDMVMRLDLHGAVIFASPACRTISADVHALEGRKILDVMHKEDVSRVRSELETFIAARVIDRPHTIRMRLHDAAANWRTFDVSVTLITSRGNEPEEIIATLREVQA